MQAPLSSSGSGRHKGEGRERMEWDGGKKWEFIKVKSIFLRVSADQLTTGVRGHIYAGFPGHVTVTSAC